MTQTMSTQQAQANIEWKLAKRYTGGIRSIARALGIETARATRAQLIVWVAQELSLTRNAHLVARYRLNVAG